jgi:hypothetical protein
MAMQAGRRIDLTGCFYEIAGLAASRGVPADQGGSSVLVTVDVTDHPEHDLAKHPGIIRLVDDAAAEATIDRVVRHFRPPIDLLYLDAVHTFEHTRA